jgi:hypothetical protein
MIAKRDVALNAVLGGAVPSRRIGKICYPLDNASLEIPLRSVLFAPLRLNV